MTDGPTFTQEYTLVRTYDAPPEMVFASWTTPEHFSRWFGPRALETPVDLITMDVRPGGVWEASIVTPDGTAHPLNGTYREVNVPSRLVLTTGDPNNTEGAVASVVTIDFDAIDEGTRMRFHQAGVNTDEAHAAGAKAGWIEFFERLGEHLKQLQSDTTRTETSSAEHLTGGE
ncbi:SRPBCC family protein [Dactylosporangium sp. CA-139066]|uniref:SRPBCC family protein n=1 Tax=Dactylosporangium sp. CA-139066 TaxID=3239930 RepID=UPI003D8A1ACC